VVCDAVATEPDYLKGLVAHLANPAVTVRIKTKPCSPSQLVAYADGERARAQDDFDQVWCVFDVDDYPDIPAAVATARRLGIEVAVSHPCFELWLILHFAPPHRRRRDPRPPPPTPPPPARVRQSAPRLP
jgi:hypothetical protein